MDGDQEYRVALSGSLPPEQANGWDDEALKEDLYGDRSRIRYARVAYNVLHHREMTATGKRVLTLSLVRVEPVPDGQAAAEEAALLELFEERTGQAPLFPMAAADDGTVGFR